MNYAYFSLFITLNVAKKPEYCIQNKHKKTRNGEQKNVNLLGVSWFEENTWWVPLFYFLLHIAYIAAAKSLQ